MTDEAALERLLNQRDGIPPVDDEPTDTSAGEQPGDVDDTEEA